MAKTWKLNLLIPPLACCMLYGCSRANADRSETQTPTIALNSQKEEQKSYPEAKPRFYPKSSNYYARKEFDAQVALSKIAILCDPGNFRFSIRASADASSVDRSYPERWVVNKEDLVEYYPEFTGEKFHREYLRKIETCGPFRIRFEGDALNSNANGQMGAEDSFANVVVVGANKGFFPARQLQSGERAVKLYHCAIGGSRQSECPDSFATQIDATYNPKFDALYFRELLQVYEDLGGPTGEIIERKSKNDNAGLSLHWSNR